MGVQKAEINTIQWRQLHAWTLPVEKALGPLIDGAVKQETLKNIASGDYQLWSIDDGEVTSYLLFHVDRFSDGTSDMVLEAIAGRGVDYVLPHIMQLAKKANVSGVQFETNHPEKIVERFTRKYGFKRLVTVFRAEL